MLLMLLPDTDFDPTESALPWAALRRAGREVHFATPSGRRAAADERLVRTGFGPLSPILMTKREDIATYLEMEQDPHFASPLCHDTVDAKDIELLIIPGGHAPGMKSLLESEPAQRITAAHMKADRPLAAVCHGVLLVARSIDPASGRSVLHGRRTTALPRTMEMSAWAMTKPFLGDYYRTYPRSVQDEVEAALASPTDFDPGPLLPRRDDEKHPGFVVRDRSYVSARWPGDCHGFARACVELTTR
jgi:putative intracellular protease/amidase